MPTSVHFMSKTNEWSTPQDFYDKLNDEFGFTLDPCATHENHKCDNYYTTEDDGLAQNWDNEIVFMNPPYGREIKNWIKKASEAVGGVVVCLIPARTDTSYWHDYIFSQKHAEVRFVRGRLKFGNSNNSAPFPSAVIIYRSNHANT